MQVGDTCYIVNNTGTICIDTTVKAIHKNGRFTVFDMRFVDMRFTKDGTATKFSSYKISFDPAVKAAVERTKANLKAAQNFEKLYVHFRGNRAEAADVWDSLPDEIKNLVR
jgi:hypothetical protein